MLSLFFLALGLACLIESLPWLIAPHKMHDFLHSLLELNPEMLRYWGIFLLCLGLFFVYLGRL